MFEPKWKLWLEKGGQPFFGAGRAKLLQEIDRTGSLSKAARAMKMSYRTAWENINQMEDAYGQPLVDRQTGGSGGGGCSLTPQAHRLLAAFLAFTDRLEETRDQLFAEMLEEISGEEPGEESTES